MRQGLLLYFVRYNRSRYSHAQTLLFFQDVRDALDSPRAILDSNKKSASGGVRECDDGLQRAFRGRKVALEFERFAFRPAEEGDQIHALHFTLMRSRNQCFRAGCIDEELAATFCPDQPMAN